jgi:hypothetical protein
VGSSCRARTKAWLWVEGDGAIHPAATPGSEGQSGNYKGETGTENHPNPARERCPKNGSQTAGTSAAEVVSSQYAPCD